MARMERGTGMTIPTMIFYFVLRTWDDSEVDDGAVLAATVVVLFVDDGDGNDNDEGLLLINEALEDGDESVLGGIFS